MRDTGLVSDSDREARCLPIGESPKKSSAAAPNGAEYAAKRILYQQDKRCKPEKVCRGPLRKGHLVWLFTAHGKQKLGFTLSTQHPAMGKYPVLLFVPETIEHDISSACHAPNNGRLTAIQFRRNCWRSLELIRRPADSTIALMKIWAKNWFVHHSVTQLESEIVTSASQRIISMAHLRPAQQNGLLSDWSTCRYSRKVAAESNRYTKVKASTLRGTYSPSTILVLLGEPGRFEGL